MLFRSNDTATTEIYTSSYTLSLHDALPISVASVIAGATSPEQVRANAAAGEWEPSAAELVELRTL